MGPSKLARNFNFVSLIALLLFLSSCLFVCLCVVTSMWMLGDISRLISCLAWPYNKIIHLLNLPSGLGIAYNTNYSKNSHESHYWSFRRIRVSCKIFSFFLKWKHLLTITTFAYRKELQHFEILLYTLSSLFVSWVSSVIYFTYIYTRVVVIVQILLSWWTLSELLFAYQTSSICIPIPCVTIIMIFCFSVRKKNL